MKSCKPNKQLDPTMRKYVLLTAIPTGIIGLLAGCYAAFAILSADAAAAAPLMERMLLGSFLALGCGSSGLILGGLLGTFLYRLSGKKME